MKEYDHTKIEKKWQREWAKKRLYRAVESADKPKFYVLDMFPYPSGEGLHVGHPKGYIATDILSRMKRMQGFNVLHPMGFDAFGLPAENYAIKTKTNPAIAVAKNVARYKKQLEIIGFDYDWSREVNTTDPGYYRWTQWIFAKLYERGLAYESYEPINWCPSCKTGLANEDVEDGRCERCGTAVEKKPMRQWVLKITDYADRLLADLDTLDWPSHIKESQRNWIGRSEGAEIEFAIKNHAGRIKVFTTRPDTLFGVTYVVLAPEHVLVTDLLKHAKNKDEVVKYVAHARMMTAIERTDAKKDKTGVKLDGVVAVNPVNKEEVPVFVADYVLADYGTGAVMAVPAHDERDWAFAKKYNLPVREVIAPHRYYAPNPPRDGKKTVTRANVHAIVRNPKTGEILGIKWKKFPWTTFPMGGIDAGEDSVAAAKREVYEETGYKNLKVTQSLGGRVVAEYFAAHKDENRVSHTSAVCFDLIDEERDPLSAEENEKHEVIWMDPKKITPSDMTHAELDVWLGRLGKEPEAYVGEGVLLDSGVFSGKKSEEVRKEITKFAGGTWVVRYKLKDWVFSRQRYWGEPFPILHQIKTKRALLIHGFEATGDDHWFKKMKKALEARGVEVHSPTVSTSHHPTIDSWMNELAPLVKDFGPDDIVIGHSLGGNAAIRLVQKMSKSIGRLFLVASAIGHVRNENEWETLARSMPESDIVSLRQFWQSPIDWNRITALVPHALLIKSKDDRIIPPHTYTVPTAWKVEEWDGFGHFDSAQGSEFDALWKRLEDFLPSEPILVSEDDLPVVLPKVKSYEPSGTGESPLATISRWVNVKVGTGKNARVLKRETNTMPQWAGSSWYYLRYMDPKNKKHLVDPKKEQYWGQVDFYVGGAEHATRHLIYARFWHKFLYDIGVVSTKEPFAKLQSVGLIMGEDGKKMSKRFGNVVNPDDIVARYGADTLRIYEMFMGPFDQAISWSTDGMIGSRRFVERVWRLRDKVDDIAHESRSTIALLHRTIAKVSDDIAHIRLNTAVSALMTLVNTCEREPSITRESYEVMLRLLAPFAPHMTEELWRALGNRSSIHRAPWPAANPALAEDDEVTIVAQVNGKVRAEFRMRKDASQETITMHAQSMPELVKWLDGKEVVKTIVVPGKLVNFVVKDRA